MTLLVKTIDGKKTEIDLTPIEEIENNLERILMHRESCSDRSHVRYSVEILEKIKELNKEQLEFLVSAFLGVVTKYSDLLQSIYDNPEKEFERIKEYKDILEKIGKSKTEYQ